MGNFLSSVVSGSKCVIVPAIGMQLASENVTGIFQVTRPETCFVPPSVLENMLKYPPGLEAVSQLKHVAYIGGPLNPTAGEKLAKVIPHLLSVAGSTEGGILQMETSLDSAHWSAVKLAELGQRMDELEPGLFELVYPRIDLIHSTHLFFHSYPHLTAFRTNDLFSPAEGQPGWWVY